MIRFKGLSVRGFSVVLALTILPQVLVAGGPKYVAGSTYFNPGVMGQPVRWANGQVRYYLDQGPLSATVNNQQATAMVDAAAALWSAIRTAGVSIVDEGSLNEDVSGQNVVPGPATGNPTISQPSDSPHRPAITPLRLSSTPTARCSIRSSGLIRVTPLTVRPTG